MSLSVIHSTEAPALGVRRLVAPIGLALALSVFLFRLWDLQIARYREFRTGATRQQTIEDSSLPARGMIVDRNGAGIATVNPTFVLYIRPDELRKPTNKGLLDRIADATGLRAYRLYRAVAEDKQATGPVMVYSGLKPAQAAALTKALKKLKGVLLKNGTDIWVDRSELSKPESEGLYYRVARQIGLDAAELAENFWRSQSEHRVNTPIAFDLTAEQAVHVAEFEGDLGGATVEVRQLRKYADSESLSHLLGYVRPLRDPEKIEALKAEGREITDFMGTTGIEQTYDKQLSGTPGRIAFEVDAFRRPLRADPSKNQDPVSGDKLTLSIDLEMQRYANKLLKEGHHVGSLVALDVKTGDVLSMVSTPGFDLRARWGGDDDEKEEAQAAIDDNVELAPEVFRPVSSRKAPGSCFKVVTTLAAALAGKFNPHMTLACPGYYTMTDGRKLKCENHAPGEVLDFHSALTKSCNTYFATIAQKLTTEDLFKAYETLGLTKKTGIDLPSEWQGLRLTEKSFDHKNGKATEGDRAQLGIGQGKMAVTPLHMALIASLVANKGWEPTPRVVRAITASGTTAELPQPFSKRLVVNLPTWVWDDLWSAMTNVIQAGTAQSAKLPFAWSGKTGTAEENKNKAPHSWFIGFGPNSAPQVAICVMVEHGGHGGATAAPIAAAWMNRWMSGRAHSTEQTSKPRVEVESASASPVN